MLRMYYVVIRMSEPYVSPGIRACCLHDHLFRRTPPRDRRYQPLRRHNLLLLLLLPPPHRARRPPLVPPWLLHLSLPRPTCATESPGSPAPRPLSTQRMPPGVNSAPLAPSIFPGKASAPTALPRWSLASTSTQSPPNADIWCVLLFHHAT